MNTSPGQSGKTVIATLCVGSDYAAYWKKYCARSWIAYARRYGYALAIFDQPLDGSHRATLRSPAWQKCLILNQEATRHYDRVVWLDADIVIAPDAPPLPEAIPSEKVGAVISGDYIQNEMKAVFIERIRGIKIPGGPIEEAWQADQRWFYEATGVKCVRSDIIIQSGVLILSHGHHRLLERIYKTDYPDDLMGYEQFPLSAAILNENLLYRMDFRFNMVFYERMIVHYPYLLNNDLPDFRRLAQLAVTTEYHNSFFLHFAYDRNMAQYLDFVGYSD